MKVPMFRLVLAIAVASSPAVLRTQSPSADTRPKKVWNRAGPLGETPKRTTEAFPLSDQANKGG